LSDKAIPINEGKKKKKKESIPDSEYYKTMSKHINGKITDLFCGEVIPFPHNYYLVHTEDEDRSLLMEMDNQIVKFVNHKKFKSDLLQFVNRYLYDNEFFPFMTDRKLTDLFRYWELYTDTIDMPQPFRFKNDPGLCFHRMPFDPIPNDGFGCPMFEEICSRIETNEKAFRAFIGSIFVPESDRQQYLYIHGEGLNGKGAIVRFLKKCLGPAYVGRQPPSKKNEDNFWNAPMEGKRLVGFSDCEQPDFPTSERFKMLSGGDAVPIRRMKREEYTAELQCKFIFASNFQLEISGQKSDQRRAIYCLLRDSDCEQDPTYEDRLWLEAPFILGWCINEYRNICPTHASIPVEDGVNEDLADDHDVEMIALFKKYFNFMDARMTSSSDISDLFKLEYHNEANTKLRQFRRWIKHYHKKENIAHVVKFDKVTCKGVSVRGLLGVCLKDAVCYKYNQIDDKWYCD